MDNNVSENEKKEYRRMVEVSQPKSALFKNCVMAFLVGGLICDIGQLVTNVLTSAGFMKEDVGTLTSIIMVFLGCFLTGIGVYDRIGKYGGAGTIVPITGFANSIVSPAMEFKREGYVLGVGAKMFIIAGPVLVYGITSSVIVGIIYYILKLR